MFGAVASFLLAVSASLPVIGGGLFKSEGRRGLFAEIEAQGTYPDYTGIRGHHPL